jgi:hypothetical protein
LSGILHPDLVQAVFTLDAVGYYIALYFLILPHAPGTNVR